MWFKVINLSSYNTPFETLSNKSHILKNNILGERYREETQHDTAYGAVTRWATHLTKKCLRNKTRISVMTSIRITINSPNLKNSNAKTNNSEDHSTQSIIPPSWEGEMTKQSTQVATRNDTHFHQQILPSERIRTENQAAQRIRVLSPSLHHPARVKLSTELPSCYQE